MYTTKCDLTCSFCMYNSGPDINNNLDKNKLQNWLSTIDSKKISHLGIYGGEPNIAMNDFIDCLNIATKFLGNKSKFVITNGTWSTNTEATQKFIEICKHNKLYIIVSGTPEHRKFQNRQVLEELHNLYPDNIRLKPLQENFHAMGRLEGKMPFSCSKKCMWWDKELRIAVQPDGNILFQNCDGIYPIVGNLNEPFSIIDDRIQDMRINGFAKYCSHYDNLIKIKL